MSKRRKIFLLVAFVSATFFLENQENKPRIVSLSTTHSEILLELGAHNYLTAVDKYVSKGRFKNIKRVDSYIVNTEEILSLKPTHVIIAFKNEELEQIFLGSDIDLIFLPPAKNLNEVYDQLLTLSKLVNKERVAQNIVEKMKKKKFEIISSVKPNRKRIYHELGLSLIHI